LCACIATGCPVFCDTALAERIERAEAELIARASEAANPRRTDTSGSVIPNGGGVATVAEKGLPFNKVAGIGFGGVPTPAALDEIEYAFGARGAPVQIELAHHADPAIGACLSERGYRLVSFENVLGLALEREPERLTRPGIEVRPSGDNELEPWLEVMANGVAHPDTDGVPSHEEFSRAVVERAERDFMAAGVRRYVALARRVIAGGVGLRMAGRRAAHRCRDRTRAPPPGCPERAARGPPRRRRSRRLRHRRRHHPASVTVAAERAARGFDLLYTRAVLVKQP
jgi:hypothetical protein